MQAYLEQPLGYEPLMQAQRPFEPSEPEPVEPENELPPAKELEVEVVEEDDEEARKRLGP